MKRQNCKLERFRDKRQGFMKAAACGIRTLRGGKPLHMVDMDSVSNVTEGGLNSLKKNGG